MPNLTDDIRALDGTLLLVFSELLRTRRAREAAHALDLSPSAVSHTLSRLRRIFGDELFIRRSHGFEPTARALQLRPALERLIDAASGLISPAPTFDCASSARCFCFAAPEFVAATITAPLLSAVAADAPGISMRLLALSESEAKASLLDGGLDFAIGRFQRAAAPLRREALYADQTCVIARTDHPDLAGALAARDWIRLDGMFSTPRTERPRQEPGAGAAPLLMRALLVSLTDHLTICPRGAAERLAEVLPIQILSTPHLARIPVFVVRRDAADAGVDWLLGQVRAVVADTGTSLRFAQVE